MYNDYDGFEYITHRCIEPGLVQEFIAIYESNLGDLPMDVQEAWTLGKMHGGFFEKYINHSQAQHRFKQAAIKGNPEAAFLLGHKAEKNFHREIMNPDVNYFTCNEYERSFENAYDRFSLSAKNGSRNNIAAKLLLRLTRSYNKRLEE